MLSTVCIGETMVMLTSLDGVPLNRATELHCGVGGAESNVALGFAAMGLESHWIGRVGDDGFGVKITDELHRGGVDISSVQVDPIRPTGIYVKVPAQVSGSSGTASVLYYRSGSAASVMGPALLTDTAVASLLERAALIHLSGITAALSPECLAMIETLLTTPRRGRLVSFDVNWRPALWAGQDRSVLRRLANLADVVLVGRDEAEQAFGSASENELRALLPDPSIVILKDGAVGAIALERDGSRTAVPALSVDVLEPVGAGDSFAAGYLSGLLHGLDQRSSLRRGHVAAACTLTVHGDRGPFPGTEELTEVLASSDAEWTRLHVSPERFRFRDAETSL